MGAGCRSEQVFRSLHKIRCDMLLRGVHLPSEVQSAICAVERWNNRQRSHLEMGGAFDFRFWRDKISDCADDLHACAEYEAAMADARVASLCGLVASEIERIAP